MKFRNVLIPAVAGAMALFPAFGQAPSVEELPAGVTRLQPPAPAAGDAENAATDAEEGPVEELAEDGATGQKNIPGTPAARRNARTLTLSIPGPRGLITDRNGEPLAQNKVGYYFALEFPLVDELEDAEVLEWAGKRIAHARGLQGLEINLPEEKILAHYKDRRWVPLQFSALISEGRAAEYRDKLTRGLILHPVYYRYYPEKETAAHIIGYVRSRGKLPTGPINRGDPLFEWTSGAAGLEKIFDDELTGKPGLHRVIFDSDGSRMLDSQEKRPEVGNTVVTTLNLKWQKHARKVLADSCERGAFVVLDIQTGDVLVLASRPSFDLNAWIPSISQAALDELNDEETTPMFSRAFSGRYPPASTFKPVVALTALTNEVVLENTRINCPAQIEIGDRVFRNHSKNAAGAINVNTAITISNNVWFYQVGIDTKAHNFLSMARRLGFGSASGLPLMGEFEGVIPSDRYMIDKYGRPTTDGDTANWSIGQGAISASPLQVAQAMAGIANGQVLPRLRLVAQVQDVTGGVLLAPEPGAREAIHADSRAVEIVHEAMRNVVHASYGTGKRAAVSFCEIAGKTGTGQWITDRNIAWFAGFLPYDNPRFAFAALYEGMPGENVSGGRNAAPMIPRFFNPLKSEIEEILTPPSRALVIIEEGEEEPESVEGVLEALPVEALDIEGFEGTIPVRAIPVEEDEWEEEISPAVPDTGEGDPLPETGDGEIPRALPVEEDEVSEDDGAIPEAIPEGE